MLSSSPMGRVTVPTEGNIWRDRREGHSLAASSKRSSAPEPASPKSRDHLIAQGHPEETLRDAGLTLDGVKGTAPSNAAVLQQLGRVLRSKTFIQSEKLCRFLRFVVEHVIHGNPECLKEYLVGVEVYDRKPPYDPSQDSIVRTEARRLRNKLKEYYGAEGKEDPVYIYLRPGSYVPAFQSRDDLAGAPSSAQPDVLPPPESSSIVTAILPFTDISGDPLSGAYARGVPDELAYALMEKECCTVMSPFSTACLAPQGPDIAATMRKVGAQIAFEGSVRVEGATLRVTARIVDAAGVQLWVERIDLEIGTKSSFAIEEDIAKALSVGFDVVRAPGLAPTGHLLPRTCSSHC